MKQENREQLGECLLAFQVKAFQVIAIDGLEPSARAARAGALLPQPGGLRAVLPRGAGLGQITT